MKNAPAVAGMPHPDWFNKTLVELKRVRIQNSGLKMTPHRSQKMAHRCIFVDGVK
jgi:hypothetical protein